MTRFMGFDGYVYLVPYVDELDYYFWKTVIPNRKAARDYLLMVFQLAFPSPRKFNTVGINAGRGINPALDNEIVQA